MHFDNGWYTWVTELAQDTPDRSTPPSGSGRTTASGSSRS